MVKRKQEQVQHVVSSCTRREVARASHPTTLLSEDGLYKPWPTFKKTVEMCLSSKLNTNSSDKIDEKHVTLNPSPNLNLILILTLTAGAISRNQYVRRGVSVNSRPMCRRLAKL